KALLAGGEVWGSLPGVYAGAAAPVRQEHDPLLFDQLRALRLRLASERGLPPYIVCHDRSLVEMATCLPTTPEALGRIYGIGQHKVAAYGHAFLTLIQAYCQEHEIQERSPGSLSPNRPATLKDQSRTEMVWQQFQQGESLQELAVSHGVTQRTIFNHLKKAFDAGKPLRVGGLQAASHLTPPEIERVQAAFTKFGTDLLRPVFDACEEQISYDELHLWRLITLARVSQQP
ncbi:MAG: HRDC domain-containing protein, partial [Anaerolineales bacterium]|nr:HRDC domain-containing protein [Anaerolineales bacterium]